MLVLGLVQRRSTLMLIVDGFVNIVLSLVSALTYCSVSISVTEDESEHD